MKLKNTYSYYYLFFLIYSLILIPKKFGTILNVIPTRLTLILGFILLVYVESKTNKIQLKKKHLGITTILYIAFLFFLIFGFSMAVSKTLYFYTFTKYIIYGLFAKILANYPFQKEQINKLSDHLLIACVFVAVYGWIQYVFDINMTRNGIYKYLGAKGRVDSNFYNSNYFSIFLYTIIIFTYFKIMTAVNNKKRMFYIIIILVLISTILLTFTRSVYLLLLAIIIFVPFLAFFYKNQSRKFLLILFSPLLFLIMLLYLIPGTKYVYSSSVVHLLPIKQSYRILNYLNNNFSSNINLNLYYDLNATNNDEENELEDFHLKVDASLESRQKYRNIIKRVIKDYRLFGIGLGNYEKFVSQNKDKYLVDNEKFGYPHDSMLHLRAEGGGVAHALFKSVLIFTILFYALRMLLEKDKDYFFIVLFVFSLTVLTGYESIFYDTQITPLFIITFYLMVRAKSENQKKPLSKNMMLTASTGGHLTQLLQLENVFNKYNYIIITEKNAVTMKINSKYKVDYLPYISRSQKIKYVFNLLGVALKSVYHFIKYNPDVIISTGTNVTVFFCYLGKIFGRKVIFIESFAKRNSPTITGKYLYKFNWYTVFVVQWEELLEFYPKAENWGWIY